MQNLLDEFAQIIASVPPRLRHLSQAHTEEQATPGAWTKKKCSAI